MSAAKEYQAFCFALGRFTLAWTDAETELYRVLLHYAGVPDEIGRAVFSGIRADTMITFLRAIFENTGMKNERTRDLIPILEHIAAINTQRNHIVHFTSGVKRAWEQDPKARQLVSNANRVSRFSNVKEYVVDVDLLNSMRADLELIILALQLHYFQPTDQFRSRENPDEPIAWRYKSPSPDNPNRQSRSSPQRQKRQQKPS